MSSQNITYSVLMYDVPLTRRALYSRLRSKIKRIALPLNWSVYLIPDGIRDDVAGILKELDADGEAKQRVYWQILRFHDCEKSELDSITRKGFETIVKNTREYLSEKVALAEQEHEEGEIDWDTMNAKRKRVCAKALRNVKDAKRLALLFDATHLMEAAFQSVEKIALAHRARFKEEIAAVKKADKKLQEEQEIRLQQDDEDAIELE